LYGGYYGKASHLCQPKIPHSISHCEICAEGGGFDKNSARLATENSGNFLRAKSRLNSHLRLAAGFLR